MNLAKHYYSIMSGVAASLGSFFGKMITFSANELVNISIVARGCFMLISCFIVARDIHDAILHFLLFGVQTKLSKNFDFN